jgi:hypothetical protein
MERTLETVAHDDFDPLAFLAKVGAAALVGAGPGNEPPRIR